jgi:hypothetical protein
VRNRPHLRLSSGTSGEGDSLHTIVFETELALSTNRIQRFGPKQ